MSRLTDYSKFDNIGDSSSSDEEGPAHHQNQPPPLPSSKPTTAPPSSQQSTPPTSTADPAISTTTTTTTTAAAKTPETSATSRTAAPNRHRTATKKTADGRYVFECDGRKVYEWEQSLEEVNIYIDAPQNIHAHQLLCTIQTNRLQIGLRDADRLFLDEPTYSKVNTADSSWYLDDSSILHIVLAKVYRGETWECALRGSDSDGRGGEAVDPATKEDMQRTMMLERFQEEHPGFDFRDAEFNGTVPDPRTFMGGIGYS